MSQPDPGPASGPIREGAAPRHRVEGQRLPGRWVVRGLWKGLQKAMLFLVRVSLLVLAIELLKGDEGSGQMAKAYGVQPSNIGKSQRVRNDA